MADMHGTSRSRIRGSGSIRWDRCTFRHGGDEICLLALVADIIVVVVADAAAAAVVYDDDEDGDENGW
jgi:hypothetical protein